MIMSRHLPHSQPSSTLWPNFRFKRVEIFSREHEWTPISVDIFFGVNKLMPSMRNSIIDNHKNPIKKSRQSLFEKISCLWRKEGILKERITKRNHVFKTPLHPLKRGMLTDLKMTWNTIMSTSNEESVPWKTKEHPEKGEPSHTALASCHKFHQPNKRGGAQGRSWGGSRVATRLTREVASMVKKIISIA